MEVGIRQLDAAELDMVAGGNAWTLVKVWAGANRLGYWPWSPRRGGRCHHSYGDRGCSQQPLYFQL